MIRLLQFLIMGHIHKWKILDHRDIVDIKDKGLMGFGYILQCEKCGDVKRKDLT